MIKLKYDIQDFKIPTTVYDFDVATFELIFEVINNNQIKLFDKWMQIFKIVGIPDEISTNLSIDEFNDIVSEFNIDITLTKIKPSITIDKIEYKAFKGTFDITVKDLILIQNYLDLNPLKQITKVMAILYKSKYEIDNNVEFTRTYIDEKSTMFKKVSSNYCIPIYNLLNNTLIKTIKTNE